jgi:hypothetical protein
VISVEYKKEQTRLSVREPLKAGNWPRLEILSSDIRVPNIDLESDRWLEGVAWSVRDRIKRSGDTKGRAVAVWHQARRQPATPLAVMTWHREPNGPFYVLDLGARIDQPKPVRRDLEAALLNVLLEASRQPDAKVAPEWQRVLRWATVHFLRAPRPDGKEYAKAALLRAKKLGFEKYEPPPEAPAALAKTWLGERDFSDENGTTNA